MKDGLLTAIEITDTHIKLIQAQRLRHAGSLTHCDFKELPEPTDPAVSKVLSQMIKAARIKPSTVTAVIPRRFAILRHLSLPSHADSEIRKMVELQIAKQIPYPREDVVLDYLIIEKQPSGYSKVLIVAVHKDVINRYLKIFKDAGVNLNSLTLSSVGLLGWFNYWQQKNKLKNTQPVA